MRNVTLYLDEFLQEALEEYTKEGEGSPSSVLPTAAHYWLADRHAGRPSWRVPSFPRDRRLAEQTVCVGLDDDTWRALEEEAHRQDVDADALAQHALVYFLADLDSGRVAERLEHMADPDA